MQKSEIPKMRHYAGLLQIGSHISNIVCDIMHLLTLILHNNYVHYIMIDAVIDYD